MNTIVFLALLAVSIQYLVLHWIGYINIQKKKHDYVIALIRFFFSVGWFVAMMAVGCAKLHILHDTTLFATYAMILGAGNFCALFVFIGFYFEHERIEQEWLEMLKIAALEEFGYDGQAQKCKEQFEKDFHCFYEDCLAKYLRYALSKPEQKGLISEGDLAIKRISKKEDRELKLFLSAILLDKMGYTEEAAERKQRFEKIAGKDYKDELLKLIEKEEA